MCGEPDYNYDEPKVAMHRVYDKPSPPKSFPTPDDVERIRKDLLKPHVDKLRDKVVAGLNLGQTSFDIFITDSQIAWIEVNKEAELAGWKVESVSNQREGKSWYNFKKK